MDLNLNIIINFKVQHIKILFQIYFVFSPSPTLYVLSKNNPYKGSNHCSKPLPFPAAFTVKINLKNKCKKYWLTFEHLGNFKVLKSKYERPICKPL